MRVEWVRGSHRRCDSSSNYREGAHAHEVVGRGGEGKHPADPGYAAMPGLAQQSDGLEPPEGFLDPFAPPLTERVTEMAAGAAVDRSGWLLRDVRRDGMIAQLPDERLGVVGLVGAERHAPKAGSVATIASAASRSARPVACVSRVFTTRPLRFSISKWPRQQSLASCPLAFLYSRACGSVVD